MPRFNPEKWKPTDDSSPGLRTEDPRRVVLARSIDRTGRLGCPCGCDEFPDGDKAVFRMGHDARLRGKLIRAHLMGVEVRYVVFDWDGKPLDEEYVSTAEEVAKRYDWIPYLESAVLRREGKNRELLKKALGEERLVKVGRWEVTGQVVAVFRLNRKDMVEVEYVNKAGDIKRVRIPADETEEING